MTSPDQPTIVPTDAVLAVVEAQRNMLHTELAKAQVLIGQLTAEVEELRALPMPGDRGPLPPS